MQSDVLPRHVPEPVGELDELWVESVAQRITDLVEQRRSASGDNVDLGLAALEVLPAAHPQCALDLARPLAVRHREVGHVLEADDVPALVEVGVGPAVPAHLEDARQVDADLLQHVIDDFAANPDRIGTDVADHLDDLADAAADGLARRVGDTALWQCVEQRALHLHLRHKIELDEEPAEQRLVALFDRLDEVGRKVDAVAHDGVNNGIDCLGDGTAEARQHDAEDALDRDLVDLDAAPEGDLRPVIVADALGDVDDVAD